MVDDPKAGQANTVIKADLIDLVRSHRLGTLPMLSMNVNVSVGAVWRQGALSEIVRELGSQATYSPAKGTAYVDRISMSVSVS